ncbi:MAG TPA: response regulator transcription factor [Chloroflexia bacterium]|nr:response regulator transcription factor [Chloroflexia bacterium]
MDKTRVVLVDDHKIVRQGLQSFIESFADLAVVGAASSGEEFLERVYEWQPEVVVMDLLLPGGIDGIETTRRAKELMPCLRVVVLTSYTDDSRVVAALRAGAIGYVRKDAEAEVLLASIRAAAQGQAVFDPSIDASLLNDIQRQAGSRRGAHNLTDREITVLRQLARGRTNREISQLLQVSEETIKTHVASILAKLHLNHRNQATIYALKHGYISLHELDAED